MTSRPESSDPYWQRLHEHFYSALWRQEISVIGDLLTRGWDDIDRFLDAVFADQIVVAPVRRHGEVYWCVYLRGPDRELVRVLHVHHSLLGIDAVTAEIDHYNAHHVLDVDAAEVDDD